MPDTILTFDNLETGEIVGDQFASDGVTVRSADPQTPPMVFDTASPTGGDSDLATDNLGKVLILSEDGDGSDPDDNATGGILIFDFAAPAYLVRFTVLDFEKRGLVRLFDADDNSLETLTIFPTGDNGQSEIVIEKGGVSRMEIEFSSSGAIDNLVFNLPRGLDGEVAGTPGDDLIDLYYTGDPEGDRIDAQDALLPGESGDDDIVKAGDGDDLVKAGLGNDDVTGGLGNDTLRGQDGDDRLAGGLGHDVLKGEEGSDRAFGQAGDDVIITSSGSESPDIGYPGLFAADSDPNDDMDTVIGGSGNDTILTGDDADYIEGGRGDDRINAGVDADTIFGDEGRDRIVAGEGADTVYGGAGDDTIHAGIDPALGFPDNLHREDDTDDLVPQNERDVVYGGDGDDHIFGADDSDQLYGGAGNDRIYGGFDGDEIDGDTGNDTLVGGEAADTLSGGDDRDLFLVGSRDEGAGDVIDGGAGGDDVDTLDLSGAGPLRVVYTSSDLEDGYVEFVDGSGEVVTGTLTFSEIENIVPCFTPGTSIATPRGEILVEDLQVGDTVITRDNGIQEIRWIGAKRMDGRELQNNPHLQPVLMQKGSLGNGLPERDMLVSPNHRMLVGNDRVSLYFDEHEVLVAAKHLLNPKAGVQTINSMGTTYIHFMFDKHEVVLANGAWTESFQPGDYTLKGMGNAQRNEIFELFPELREQQGQAAFASARLTLKRHEAKMLFR